MLCRDYCEGLRDSLDLVPIAAWHGNGRKVGWLSPFLLAAWDPATEQFQSVCRCMSGFTDAFYQQVRTSAHSPPPAAMPAHACLLCMGLQASACGRHAQGSQQACMHASTCHAQAGGDMACLWAPVSAGSQRCLL